MVLFLKREFPYIHVTFAIINIKPMAKKSIIFYDYPLYYTV